MTLIKGITAARVFVTFAAVFVYSIQKLFFRDGETIIFHFFCTFAASFGERVGNRAVG